MGDVVKIDGGRPAKAWPSDEEFNRRFDAMWDGDRISEACREHIRYRVSGSSPGEKNVAARRILDFLNDKRRLYYPRSPGFLPAETNLRLIRARLVEGITEDQLRAIIALKVRQAGAGDFDPKYLRPATLFGASHCHQYYGELGQ